MVSAFGTHWRLLRAGGRQRRHVVPCSALALGPSAFLLRILTQSNRYNMTNDSDVDDRVLHAGLPVLDGEKWGMNVWIRQRAVQTAAFEAAASDDDNAASASTAR
jgi:hypothetical protein